MTRPADDPGLKLTPYWWEAAPCAEIEPAEVPAAIDVAIVGAGFTGLSAALTLARAGRSVALFDAMRAGEGASSRNGGITSGNVKFPFPVLIEKMGLEIAKAIYGEGVAARDHLARLVTKEGIECNYKLVGRFTGANSAKSYERMGREADSLNKHFGIGVEMVPQAEQHREIGTDFYHGGQFRHDIGGVHPSLLHAGMLACALDAGAHPFGPGPGLARTATAHDDPRAPVSLGWQLVLHGPEFEEKGECQALPLGQLIQEVVPHRSTGGGEPCGTRSHRARVRDREPSPRRVLSVFV